jgi:O-methyltransferase involved in polyketide biosynthesis
VITSSWWPSNLKASLPEILRLPALTLAAHACEHLRVNGIFCDPVAADWYAQLTDQYRDLPVPDLELTNGIITRSVVIDYVFLGLMATTEDPFVVVDLGCGFSTRPYRMMPNVDAWIHVDLPEVIAMRKSLRPPGRFEFFYSCDLTDDDYLSSTPEIKKGLGSVFILEGVLNHLSKDAARALLRQLHARFYGGYVIGTVITQNGLKGAQSLAGNLKVDSAMWAIEDVDELREWLKPIKMGRVTFLGKVSSRIGLIRPTTGDEASGLVFMATL